MSTTNTIPLDPPAPLVRICSFCKKQETQVKKMVSNNSTGPQLKCICNECIEKATERLLSDKAAREAQEPQEINA